MATMTYWSSDLSRLNSLAPNKNVVTWVKQAEKRTFPHNEAFNFDVELKKQNTELMITLDEGLLPNPGALIAYLVFSRHKNTALLHKVCVLEKHRRQGVARRMLRILIERLKSRNCENVKLWVDEKRVAAKCLYTALGFKQVDRLEDYYAPGRTGVQMMRSLLITT